MTSEEVTKVKKLFDKIAGWLGVFPWYEDIARDFNKGVEQMETSYLTEAEERSQEAYEWLQNNKDIWNIPANAISEFKRAFPSSKK